MLNILIILFIFLFILNNHFKKKHKTKQMIKIGKLGEKEITSLFLKYLDCNILSNVYIPMTNGWYTEIDILVIHASGIYVIESKNFSGYIFGDEKNKTWTQVIGKDNRRKFYNPILQNRSHLLWLQSFLEDNGLKIPVKYFKSEIIFSNNSNLKNVKSREVSVINVSDIPSLCRKIKNRKSIFNQRQINKITNLLNKQIEENIPSHIKKQHAKNVNNYLKK